MDVTDFLAFRLGLGRWTGSLINFDLALVFVLKNGVNNGELEGPAVA